MLDGLLGRSGFSSKCKSLIKPTRTRIEVLRRRAEAKQRFLKEDLVKLLANGLDVNAYGRTEEFIAGLNLLSCYTFIDQSCEYILKQLSIMQKLGPCPEECRETVASLMFAAARFSDLPELRDLRDVFQEKYGTGLECYVNQAFVEKLASKPPVVEKRISLLQDIAAEFSIQWDSKGFKQRMDKPSTVAQDQATKVGPLSVTDDKYKQQNGNNVFRKNDHRSKERIEFPHQGPTSHGDGNLNIRRKELFMAKEDNHQKERKEHHHNINVYDMRKGEEKHHKERKDYVTAISNDMRKEEEKHHKERKDHVTAISDDMRKEEEKHHKERKDHVTAISNDMRKEEENHHKERKDHVTAISNDRRKEEKHHKERKHHVTAISNGTRDDKQDGEKSTRKVNVEEAIRSKPIYNSPLPPPYVKLNIPPPYSKPHNPSNSEKIKKEAHHEFEEDDCNYQNNIPLPKPRSVRRKHSKSSSSHDDIGSSEDTARIVKRISSSKRKERKGLQILFDDEHYHSHKDEEEKMMDKLLLHYSKKPSAYDARMLRKKKSSRSNTTSKSPSPHHKNEADVLVPPTRSISLPHEQSGESEPKKVYARANSFQPDNQAKHVHPKLPDYDDLAARFAALRGR